MSTSTELGAFLRSRRARVHLQDVGMRPHGGVRRVPGLRREELAQLAGSKFRCQAGYSVPSGSPP